MAFERLDDSFVLKHANFKTWCCVKFGFDHKWIGVGAVATIADEFVTDALADNELLDAFDLSQLHPSDDEKATHLLARLADLERSIHETDKECWKLWLSLGLLWLCRHQRFVKNPLYFAEDLVDDVAIILECRPKEACSWLRFMAANPQEWDPTRHSYEENYQRLMHKWKAFLVRYADQYLKDFHGILSKC